MRTPNLLNGQPPRVKAIMQDAADRYNLTVVEMVNGPKTAQACAAKSMVAKKLRGLGFSYSSIGRHLSLHHTSVMAYMKMRPKIKPGPVVIPCPDLSGEWAI